MDSVQELNKKLLEIQDTMLKMRINELSPDSETINRDINNGLTLSVHQAIIAEVIRVFLKKNGVVGASKYFTLGEFRLTDANPQISVDFIKEIKNMDIVDALDLFHREYLNSVYHYQDGKITRQRSKDNIKFNGAVYTPKKIAEEIVAKTIENRISTNNDKTKKLRILDFGCGTGVFYQAAFDYLSIKLKLKSGEIISENLFAIDIDPVAIDILRLRAAILSEKDISIVLDSARQNIVNKNMLIPADLSKNHRMNVCYADDFKKAMSDGGFDIILSNPPYSVLKLNKKDKIPKETIERMENEIRFFRKSGLYVYSVQGMLNYYRLSIEMMLRIAKKRAELGIICPSTLFADISSKKLRKHLLFNNKVREVKFFSEKAGLFDGICQSTAIFYLQKEGCSDTILMNTDNGNFGIPLDMIKKLFSKNYEVPPQIDEIGWNILQKLSKFKKLEDFKEIRNKRGELDLTMHKKLICRNNTGHRLVRGKMIAKDGIRFNGEEYVVIKPFLDSKGQEYRIRDFNKKRIVCQQISNMNTKKRINFVLGHTSDILANSCNYISVDNDKILDDLRILLNSHIIDWRFRATSSNNHINNYELAELPIPDLGVVNLPTSENELKLNLKIGKIYGLNKHEMTYILNGVSTAQEIDEVWDLI